MDVATVYLEDKWQAETYHMTFETSEGEKTLDYTVEDDIGELLAQFPDISLIPKRSGYDAVWQTVDKLVPGGMIVEPVYTEIIYVVVFKENGNIRTTEEWTVSSGAVKEPFTQGLVWKTENGEDYKLSPESFTYNEETGRYELVLHSYDYSENEVDLKMVRFIVNDKPIITKYYVIGEETVIFIPEVPYKKGYIGKWNFMLPDGVTYNYIENSITVGANIESTEDIITINAIYEAIEYTVIFDSLGGDSVDSITVKYDETHSLPTVERVGYKFNGWYLSENYAVNEKVDDIFNLTSIDGKAVTLYAKWTPITYKIIYNNQNGETQEIELEYDETHIVLDIFNGKLYHDFTGWNGLYAAGQKIKNLTDIDGKEITFDANYNPKTYYVTFMADGNAVGEKVEYKYGEAVLKGVPDVPERAHYDGAWDSYQLTYGDFTVEAVYTPKEYTVIFLDEENASVGEYKYTVESIDISVPDVPHKEGYNGAWESYVLDGGDKEIRPVYTATEYKVYFYDKEGGELIGESIYTVDDKYIDIPPVPYGYSAWNIPELTYGNVNVYATENTVYTVTFLDKNENVVSEIWVNSGEKLNAYPKVPHVNGYTGKWVGLEQSITCDTVIRVEYTPIVYTVTFYNDRGEVVDNGVVTYTVLDRNIKIPAVPERFENNEHYTGAWNIPELTYGDAEAHPVYTPKIYKVNFLKDGVVEFVRTYTIEYPYISVPAVPHTQWSPYHTTCATHSI